jgi:DNA-directed RNA polymerase subunit K/omega
MPLDNISELKRRVPGGKYLLTRAVAERARQLQEGAPPLTPVSIANPLSVAIDEIVQGKITFQLATEQPELKADEIQAEPEEISTDDILPVELAAETSDDTSAPQDETGEA